MKAAKRLFWSYFDAVGPLFRWRYGERGIAFFRALRPAYADLLTREAAYYRRLADEALAGGLAFDIGAHEGHTVRAFLDAGHPVIAFEPTAVSYAKLRARFPDALADGSLGLDARAVSKNTGRAAFNEAPYGSAFNTLESAWREIVEARGEFRFGAAPRVIPTVSLREAIGEYGRPTLIKVDVEGHERAVFETLDEPVPLLAFEANLPAYLTDTCAIVERLANLGYRFDYAPDYARALGEWVGSALIVERLTAYGKGTVEVLARHSDAA